MKHYIFSLFLLFSYPLFAALYTITSCDSFHEKIAQGNVVVDFYADWCGPCKRMHPIIEKLSQQLPSITFLKVNTDKCKSIATEYLVQSLPTLLFFKNGKRVGEQFGALSEKDLTRKIRSIFG